MYKYLLGSVLRSKFNAFEGIATARLTTLHSCDRYFLTPPMIDGKPQDGYYLDEVELDLVKESEIPDVIPVYKFNLGDLAESDITGQTGVITHASQNVNGCIRYIIQPKVDKNNKMIESTWVTEGELSIIKPTRPQSGKSATGGPPSKKC